MIPSKEDIISILKSVKDPESELTVYDLGIIRSIDYRAQEQKLIINIDFKTRNPSCIGCLPIAWLVQKKITDELSTKFLEYPGVKTVEYIDK